MAATSGKRPLKSLIEQRQKHKGGLIYLLPLDRNIFMRRSGFSVQARHRREYFADGKDY